MKIQLKRVILGGIMVLAVTGTGCASRAYYVPLDEPPICLESIISLSRSGSSDREIIRKIDRSRTIFFLRSEEILRLHREGVSDQVIDHLISVREWTLLAYPTLYARTFSSRQAYQLPRKHSEISRPMSLVPVAVH